MPDYEIRLLNDDYYSTSVVIEKSFSNDHAAIKAAADLAGTPWFEVWRDIYCVYGLPSGRTQTRSPVLSGFAIPRT